jgi:hypothetical protein
MALTLPEFSLLFADIINKHHTGVYNEAQMAAAVEDAFEQWITDGYSLTQFVAAFSSAVANWNVLLPQWRAWLVGTATGGYNENGTVSNGIPPNGGYYPLANGLGQTFYIASPQKNMSLTAEGAPGADGADGLDGIDAGVPFVYSNNTADSDPGAGGIKFNAATFAGSNQIFVDVFDKNGNDVTAWLDSQDDSTNNTVKGTLYIRESGSNKFCLAEITGVTVIAGYRKLVITPRSYSAMFTNAATLLLLFVPSGNRGAQGDPGTPGEPGPEGPPGPAGSGSGDVLGPAVHADALVPVWSGANTKTLGAGRAVGVGAANSLLDRAAGDGRYLQTAANLPAAQLTGTIDPARLPAIAINDIYTVANQAAMLALAAVQGDVAVRTDLGQAFMLSTSSPGTLADWILLPNPVDAVLSVAGLTGTITAAALAAALDTNSKPTTALMYALSDESTVITAGVAKLTVRLPFAFTITDIRASLKTAGSTLTTVDINENGATILSTKLTIDATEKTSVTAATAHVRSDSNLADDAELTFDIDGAGTGAVGLKVYIIGRRA